DYAFNNSPLTLTSELYYKKLSKLVPYKIEDLKIRYLADQQSKGYAYGADFSLNGEFVNGMKSFFRLSLMKTSEDVSGDSYISKDNVLIQPGYLRRPTDQRVNFSIFFQDRLMEDPSYKVHVNILYGSALVAGPPQTERYADIYKIPSYKRMDIGFSKDFLDNGIKKSSGFFNRCFSSFTATAELFNILNIDNTVSYLWIRDANSNQYAVPNYLTSRQLNIRISANIKYK
ncbi:MAG TPA: TonB-dependent receptor, partial [Sphingobacteriaceae bacterium]|nr:TonB-dependent receptor [Sphingobacteriaceae bacterium]